MAGYVSFATTSSVRQGCVVAPALFYISINWILTRCASSIGISVGNTVSQTLIMLMTLLCSSPEMARNPYELRLSRSDSGFTHIVVED